MSESRKNHFDVDGAQGKEEEHAASYKPIPETDTEFRPPSKASLSKSKEKVSADGAEEKLLSKEDEAKITTRVDMAEAKYVVGDHRNGDAKIELDANKRQFSGLTKEELLKYAEDPFWVRLRWFMFVLFWALWLCMLAGAIAIIIRAPKCYPPTPKTWYEVGPLADRSSVDVADYNSLTSELDSLAQAKVQGIFINPCASTYDVLDSTTCIDDFKKFLVKAKDKGIKLIVDLIANYVPKSHKWFIESENKTEEFKDFFVWGVGKDAIPDGSRPDVPNNWISIHGSPAWSWSDTRRQYYLHQYYEHQPDLNFHNKAVQTKFEEVMRKWLDAGASGVRLHKARQLLVDMSLSNETIDRSALVTQNDYSFLRHNATSDMPELDELVAQWSNLVASLDKEHVFTLYEDGRLKPEWYVLRNLSSLLRPPSAAPLTVGPHPAELPALANTLNKLADNWTALQLTSSDHEVSGQLLTLAMALPLTPLIAPGQLPDHDNNTALVYSFGHLSELREEASIKFGERRVVALPAHDNTTQFLAVARWKAGHTGFVSVLNAGPEAAAADLEQLESLPPALTVHHVADVTREHTEYKKNDEVQANNVTIPARSAIVFSYVPKLAAEK